MTITAKTFDQICTELFPIIFSYLLDDSLVRFFQPFSFFNLLTPPVGPVAITKIPGGWVSTKPITSLKEAKNKIIYFMDRLFVIDGYLCSKEVIDTLLFLGHKKQIYYIPLHPPHHIPRIQRYVLRENTYFYCYYNVEKQSVFFHLKKDEKYIQNNSTSLICNKLHATGDLLKVLSPIIRKKGLEWTEYAILGRKDPTKFNKLLVQSITKTCGALEIKHDGEIKLHNSHGGINYVIRDHGVLHVVHHNYHRKKPKEILRSLNIFVKPCL